MARPSCVIVGGSWLFWLLDLGVSALRTGVKVIVVLLGLAVATTLGALVFAWSGLGDIAASQGHWPFVERFLDFGMRHAVTRHASDIEVPKLDDPNMIRLGAAHFHRGCAFCHGAPGIPVNPIAKHMLPPPPDLAVTMRPWQPNELFWIVKNGFKYTGMPGWVAIEREDEIWAVVAFLTRVQGLTPEAYRDLALGNIRLPQQKGAELATFESNPRASGACARCHGDKNQLPLSNLVPVLHGQPADYLLASLKAYAEGKRRSGIMQPLAADLREEDRHELAEYYSGLAAPQEQTKTADAALVEQGHKLAVEGRPHSSVPPCAACHASAGLYPRLAGQHAAYMATQLRLRKAGLGPSTDAAAIMTPIAQQLSDEDIEAVSSYFATLSPSEVHQP
jgi:cytochrome c553